MALSDEIVRIEEKRARSKPLPTGVAPYTSSSFFKIHDLGVKPKAARWDHRLSLNSLNQKVSALKSSSHGKPTTMISLGTARPSSAYNPWVSMALQCLNSASTKATATSSVSCTRGEAEYDLAVAMNYGYTSGSPQVLRYITEHVELIHNPPYDDWESCLTCGSTSAFEMALRMFCNPNDAVLVEKYTYSGTIMTINAQGLRTVGIEMDRFGLCPDDLDRKLENWDTATGPKPFVLYTIPTGQNPTGTTQSADRRREVYRVAVKHDLYIIEDDPYYYLQMGGGEGASGPPSETAISPDGYLGQLPPSYLSLDVCGRVLRMDTASKILAPGLRCGWVTGCSQIVDKFVAYSEVCVLSPSGPSQVMMYKLLDQTWGHNGFIRWLSSLSQQYLRRRDTLIQACVQALPQDVCHWETPTAGLLLWIRVDVRKHPSFGHAKCASESRDLCLQIEERIFNESKNNGVLVSKGSWFAADEQLAPEVFFRLTFAAAPEEVLCEAVHGFAKAVRSEFNCN